MHLSCCGVLFVFVDVVCFFLLFYSAGVHLQTGLGECNMLHVC